MNYDVAAVVDREDPTGGHLGRLTRSQGNVVDEHEFVAGVDAEIFGYQGEGHSFIGDPWFVFMGKTQLFFDKYVKEP